VAAPGAVLHDEHAYIALRHGGGVRDRSVVRRLAVAGVVAVAVALAPAAVATAHAQVGGQVSAIGAAATWTPPLSTRGRYIVDANGQRFKLRSGNWHGASGTWTGSGDAALDANHHAGENSGRIPLGLDRAPIWQIISGFLELGINSIRLPFSNEMLYDQVPLTDAAVAANPQLRALTPLQVYDAVVAALTDDRVAVMLNDHTHAPRWCCAVDGNERWNSSQSVQTWEDDWLFLVRRYAGNPRVVGADLYNEVRRDVWDDPNWGLGDSHDWFAASQHLGDRILQEANPNLLIIVEGINWYGIPFDFLPHGRPTLAPVASLSHTLVTSGKLVYSAHFYDYTGPNHSGATGLGETSDPRYRDFSRADLFNVLYQQAFYVADQADQHFTAPVWISEFGIGKFGTGNVSRAWFSNFVDYLIQTDADFSYWPLVGWHENRTGNGWALLSWDRAGSRMGLYDGDDWRADAWTRLITAASRTGYVGPVADWSMLSPDHGDFIQSLRMRAQPDWDSGARKAACSDGQRLIGLSHTGNRGLCTDAGAANLWASSGAYTVVWDERYVTSGDWASGYTKLQCPNNSFLIGYAVRGAAVSTVLCAASNRSLGTAGRTVWFDRGDNRGSASGGDFAYGHYKGQCATDEYVAGIAFTHRIFSSGKPDALYCRRLA
jgi:hypothetical protein